MSDQTQSLRPFPFLALPTELRLLILSHTELVDLECLDVHYNYQKSGFVVYSSQQNSSDQEIPLFNVSRTVREDALAVCLPYSRIRLHCNLAKNKEWLELFEKPMLQRIRYLSVVLTKSEAPSVLPSQDAASITRPARALFNLIADRLDIAQLHLAIDVENQTIQMQSGEGAKEAINGPVELWYRLASHVKGAMGSARLGRFSFYLPGRHLRGLLVVGAMRPLELCEHIAKRELYFERMVMGEHYSSYALGKLPFLLRKRLQPHTMRTLPLLLSVAMEYRRDPENDGKGRVVVPEGIASVLLFF